MDYTMNNMAGLKAFSQTEQYQALRPAEKAALGRFMTLGDRGELDKDHIREVSKINDPWLQRGYNGADKVSAAVKALGTEGFEIEYFLGNRPYLFTASEDGSQFYFLRNADITDDSTKSVEVLEVKSGTWKRVDDISSILGTQGKEGPLDGPVKEDFLVAQFDRDEGRVAASRDNIGFRVEKESVGPLASGSKYHCDQQAPGLCQLHAANAFLGYRGVIPSEFNEFVTSRTAGFFHEGVEGLSRGGDEEDSCAASSQLDPEIMEALKISMDIENGTDMVLMTDYIRALEKAGELRMSVSNMQVGRIFMEGGKLMFIDNATETPRELTSEMLQDSDRVMLGTSIPVHAKAFRRNSNHTWTEVDSFVPAQVVHSSLSEALISTLESEHGAKTSLNPDVKHYLPFTFAKAV